MVMQWIMFLIMNWIVLDDFIALFYNHPLSPLNLGLGLGNFLGWVRCDSRAESRYPILSKYRYLGIDTRIVSITSVSNKYRKWHFYLYMHYWLCISIYSSCRWICNKLCLFVYNFHKLPIGEAKTIRIRASDWFNPVSSLQVILTADQSWPCAQ